MSALSVHRGDCSLVGWPSISQFDDFVWTGLGEIDPLENWAQPIGTTKAEYKLSTSAIVSPEGPKLSQLYGTTDGSRTDNLCHDSIQRSQSPTLLQADSLDTSTWDSMNASDLASVLDTTFPCESSSSIPTNEDGYALYTDELLMQPERILSGNVDIFMADPICEDNDAMTVTGSTEVVPANVNSAGRDCASLNNQDQEILTDCNWEHIADIDSIERDIDPSSFGEMLDDSIASATVAPPLTSFLDCKLPKFACSQPMSGKLDECQAKMELLSNKSPILPSTRSSQDLGFSSQCSSTDATAMVTASRQSCVPPDIRQQWQMMQPLSNRKEGSDRGKSSKLSERSEEGHLAASSPRNKLGELSRLSSQMKINQAQASRARRLAASQRRAEGRARKQLPFQKLIRMSSPSNPHAARYRAHQSLPPLVPMLHTPAQISSQNLSGETQSSQVIQPKQHIQPAFTQTSTFVPIVVSGPPFSSLQVQQSYPLSTNHGQSVPSFVYQQHQQRPQHEMPLQSLDKNSIAVSKEMQLQPSQKVPLTLSAHHGQEQCFSSESGVTQSHLAQQSLQSLPTAPGPQYGPSMLSLIEKKVSESQLGDDTLEATMLQQLESTVRKLGTQTRLCIRDSLYRLAKSATERQTEADSRNDNMVNEYGPINSSPILSCGVIETQTNPMDRWIANLLFCKQSNVLNNKPVPYPHIPSETSSQMMLQPPNKNGSTKLWSFNGCCVNPQETRLCTY